MPDPILAEIEIQLKLAQQALNNVAAFVARVNAASESEDESDSDGDEPMESYEDFTVPPTPPTTGGRTNGRKRKVQR